MTEDPAFTAWLRTLPALGYPADWTRRNMPALRKAFEERGGAPMQPCPQRARPVDRYEEL